MPELHWLANRETKRAVRRVPCRQLHRIETVGDSERAGKSVAVQLHAAPRQYGNLT